MSNEETNLYVAYVTQLRSEHRRVKQCLAKVERQWGVIRQRSPSVLGFDDLIGSLTELREELFHHFAEEQAGGCVEEAVSHAPHLSRDRAQLERDDHKLIKLIDGLIKSLCKSPESIKGVEKKYFQLVQQIGSYEAAESRLVAESFGIDVD